MSGAAALRASPSDSERVTGPGRDQGARGSGAEGQLVQGEQGQRSEQRRVG